MENERKFIKCPLCKEAGHQDGDNKLVWTHETTDNRGWPIVHRWSVKSGRMFIQQASEDDSVW